MTGSAPPPAKPSLDELLDFAVSAARAAGEITLKYFQKNPEVETKPDRSPVTVADRESEQLLRRQIEDKYPHHGILGEEFGATRPAADWKWVLDPIDGTQSFIRGVPLYGVMVGVERNGEPMVGVVHFPALRETVWASAGGGTWWNGARAHVSAIARIEEATLLTTDPLGFAPVGKEAAYQRLRKRVGCERGWGDCYGHILVATGRAEIMLDPVLHEWDAAPLIPILEEAGGKFVDWPGARNVRASDGIGTNGALFEAVMKMIAG